MNRGTWIIASFVILFLCSCSDRLLEPDKALDTTFPQIEIFSPSRGMTISGESVWVRGRVSDDRGIERIRVQDQELDLDNEGYFETSVLFPKNGLHIIETSVFDGAGNESKDVRSVMSMSMNSSTDIVKDAVSLFLGPMAFERIASLVDSMLESDSLPDAVVDLEPVKTGGSCLGATLDFESFEYEETEVALIPQSGSVHVSTTIFQLRTDIDTRFKVSCIPGTADVVARVNEVRIEGDLAINVVDGKVVASTDESLSAELVGFRIDIDNVPGVLESLIENSVRSRIEEFVEEELAEIVPELVAGVFEGFSGGQAITLLEKEVFIKVVPTLIDIEERGLDLIADASSYVDEYTAEHNNVIVEKPFTGESDKEFELFLTTEFVNQFSATLWASGVLDTGVPIEGEGRLASIVSDVTLGWMLPPFVDKTEELDEFELRIGDAFTVASNEGGVVTQIAISSLVEVDLEITDGLLYLDGQTQKIWLDILENGVTGANVFANPETEALASHSARHAAKLLLDALNGKEIPLFQGLQIKKAEFDATVEDYVAIKGSLDVAESSDEEFDL